MSSSSTKERTRVIAHLDPSIIADLAEYAAEHDWSRDRAIRNALHEFFGRKPASASAAGRDA